MRRPWSKIPINECGEDLVQIKTSFHCLEPHPYLSLGAPYGDFYDPWRLRTGVIHRLNLAQEYLDSQKHGLHLAIFDAWRPIPVQSFMFDHVINENCLARGLDRNDLHQRLAYNHVVKEVEKFWATPSNDPSIPPPHSTGAAIDLTLVDSKGLLLDMGGEIDQIGPISFPNHYLKAAENDLACRLIHQRRASLAHVMLKAGFEQHPNEWWHFSYGDQLWAWKSNTPEARYGSFNPSDSKERTASSPKFST